MQGEVNLKAFYIKFIVFISFLFIFTFYLMNLIVKFTISNIF